MMSRASLLLFSHSSIGRPREYCQCYKCLQVGFTLTARWHRKCHLESLPTELHFQRAEYGLGLDGDRKVARLIQGLTVADVELVAVIQSSNGQRMFRGLWVYIDDYCTTAILVHHICFEKVLALRLVLLLRLVLRLVLLLRLVLRLVLLLRLVLILRLVLLLVRLRHSRLLCHISFRICGLIGGLHWHCGCLDSSFHKLAYLQAGCHV